MIPISHIAWFVCFTALSSIIFSSEILKFYNFSKLSFCINFPVFSIETNANRNNALKNLTFAVYSKSTSEDHLFHVFHVLEKLGLQRVSIEQNWDLLWSHDFPFANLTKKLKNLAKHQKVNHFPGCGFLTNKVDLSVTNLPFQPKSFRLPNDKEDLIKYSTQNPHKLFVEKNNKHRYIHIKELNHINVSSLDVFAQEYVENPYLVDGYKFDIGVYVILTSVDPLRIYVYNGDVLFRYCKEKYYPFNSSVTAKYVVGDNYLPTWKIPSLAPFFKDLGFGMKATFDGYLILQDQDPNTVWDQIEEIIRQIALSKEKSIKEILRSYKSKRNFFELMRFDFIVDENLKVWLIEANMSPNLSSAHFKPNSLLYEQLLYNVMQLVGVGDSIKGSTFQRNFFEETMLSAKKNLAVFQKECFEELCHVTCNRAKCNHCMSCLSNERLQYLHIAYREHIQRSETKRIFPKPIGNFETYDIDKEVESLSKENQFMVKWFYGKCQMDVTWCK